MHLELNPIPTRKAQRTQTNLVCTRTQRPHRDGDRTVFECLLWRYTSAVARCRAGAVGAADLGVAQARSEEVSIFFIIPTIVWPQVNSSEGTQPHPSTETWIKDLLSMAPSIRTSPNFSLSQSLPSRSFHKSLTDLHQRADRLQTTVTGN